MAGAHHLHRLLGPRLAIRQPSQSRHRRDHAPAGDAGRPRAAEGVGQERARPCDPGVHERAGARIRLMSATTRSIRSNRRRRSTSWSARASRRARRRGRIWGLRRRGEQRRLPPQTLLFLQRRRPCARRPQRFRGIEQKENIFLTAYAGHGIVSYSGRSGGGDQAPPFPTSPDTALVGRNARCRTARQVASSSILSGGGPANGFLRKSSSGERGAA